MNFGQDCVLQLEKEDFNGLSLRLKECQLVLFYDDSSDSLSLIPLWGQVACSIAGPILGAYNVNNDLLLKDVLDEVPCIGVYREGELIGFYEGKYEVREMIQYALWNECQPEKIE